MTKPLPSVEELQKTFQYVDGKLYWKRRGDARPQWNATYPGKIAGNVRYDGRTMIALKGYRLLRAYRVIWKMFHGDEPAEIDHIDGNPSNDRLENLRPATRTENARNVKGRAVSGRKGVSFHQESGLWRARIRVNGKELCRYYNTADAAATEYSRMASEHYGEFARAA